MNVDVGVSVSVGVEVGVGVSVGVLVGVGVKVGEGGNSVSVGWDFGLASTFTSLAVDSFSGFEKASGVFA